MHLRHVMLSLTAPQGADVSFLSPLSPDSPSFFGPFISPLPSTSPAAAAASRFSFGRSVIGRSARHDDCVTLEELPTLPEHQTQPSLNFAIRCEKSGMFELTESEEYGDILNKPFDECDRQTELNFCYFS